MTTMTLYVARVHNGRLILDVPTVLPEGSELELVAAKGDDLSDLDETERRQLAADIAAARADAAAGRGEDIDAVLRRIQGAKPGSE